MALEKMLVSAAIRPHGRLVARVSEIMAAALVDIAAHFDGDLLFAGGLLHDLAKGRPDHGRQGAEVLAGLGLGPVAEIVSRHCDLAVPKDGILTEAHLVCLADKVVSGIRLMPPGDRFQQKLEMYGGDATACVQIEARRDRCLALQDFFERTAGHNLLSLLRGAGL